MKGKVWLIGVPVILAGMALGQYINSIAGIIVIVGAILFMLYFLKEKRKK